MPEENEKIEDFINLWKKKISSENKSSVIGDSINKIEELQNENEDLKLKITENLQLITKSEEMLKAVIQDKERLILEKEELKSELTKRENYIGTLEEKIKQLELENEDLNKQVIEKIHSMPIDYVLPVNNSKSNTIKPPPAQGTSLPLETLCQDLQTDLNKYKRIVEKLTEEKSQLRNLLEEKGVQFNIEDLERLKSENETLRNDLEKIQKSLEKREASISQSAMRQVEDTIKDFENKLKEKDSIIADLKLSQSTQLEGSNSSMTPLIENLQNQINKLKILVKEKDQKISDLTEQLTKI